MAGGKLVLKAGSIFRTFSDGIVVPVAPDSGLPNYAVDNIREHFGIEMLPVVFHNLGQLNVYEYENNRSNNLKPKFHLLIPVLPEGYRLTMKMVVDLIRQLSSFAAENPEVRDIALPFPNMRGGEIGDADIFDTVSNLWRKLARKDCTLEIYVGDEDRYLQLSEEIKELAAERHELQLLRKNDWSEDLVERRFYIAKSYFGDVEIFQTFLRKSVWYAEITPLYRKMISRVKVGSFLFLDYTIGRSEPFISLQAVGEVTGVDEDLLHVSWTARNFNEKIKNRDYPDVPLFEVRPLYVKKELLTLYRDVLFREDNWDSETELASSIGISQSVGHIDNDSDRGVDLLDIADDVNGFARIIALRNFKPPLAIALCGKWGSGKSFFMNKLIESIDQLSAKNPEGLFCPGVVHIRFNAWSYMDSNLWASMVGRIFSGLNSYISADRAEPKVKQEIRNELQKRLNLTREGVVLLVQERDANEQEIADLNRQKESIKKALDDEINKMRSKSLKSFISKIDQEFQVGVKVEKALQENASTAEISRYVREHFPKEVWGEPEYLKKELSSGYAFVLEFFRKDRLWWNIAALTVILAVIWGVNAFLPGLLASLKIYRFKFPADTLAVLTVAGALMGRALESYKRIKPLFASLWKISAQYQSELTDARFRWEQQEKALKIELDFKKEKIAWIDAQLIEHEALKNTIQYRLDNTLNAEALSRFVSQKSGEDGYRKHQGIIATIREDFEILTELFVGIGEEKGSGIAVGEGDGADRKLNLQKPIERIVLYIDDLDRCSEERIVEVLEAVHLLMAFKLFVVVAGIDPDWVKAALKNKRVPAGMDTTERAQATPSFYLEKIFQVPFHLKVAREDSIREMIRTLLNGKQQYVGFSVATADEGGQTDPGLSGADVRFPNIERLGGKKTVGENTQHQLIDIPRAIETLVLGEEEITMLSEFAVLLGANPRTVKRFVNTYQIIRAHDSLKYITWDTDVEQLQAIMFLLALNIGEFRDLRSVFFTVIGKEDGNLANFLEAQGIERSYNSRVQRLDNLLSSAEMHKIRGIDYKLFQAQKTFVCRFSFD